MPVHLCPCRQHSSILLLVSAFLCFLDFASALPLQSVCLHWLNSRVLNLPALLKTVFWILSFVWVVCLVLFLVCARNLDNRKLLTVLKLVTAVSDLVHPQYWFNNWSCNASDLKTFKRSLKNYFCQSLFNVTHFLISVTEKCGSFLRKCFCLSHFFRALKAILVKVTSISSVHQLEFSDAEIKPGGCFLMITALPINSDETWAAFWNSFRLECIIFSIPSIF